MKKINEMYVIGIDHGYGNMKTANCCFPTGVMKRDTEPTFVSDLLIWNKKYYSIGANRIQRWVRYHLPLCLWENNSLLFSYSRSRDQYR